MFVFSKSPHPEDVKQMYVASFQMDLTKEREKPFDRMRMTLKLNDDKDVCLFASGYLRLLWNQKKI
jgi:hypothetical protein